MHTFSKALRPWFGPHGQPVGRGGCFGILGILNATPDSFYDGGNYCDPRAALARCSQMLEDGADVIDIGAASSRPGAEFVPEKVEQARLLPVLSSIRSNFPDAVISVDTTQAGTASLALGMGAGIVNDISACRADPGLVDVLAQYRPGYVLMHSGGEPKTMQIQPKYSDVVEDVKYFFAQRLNYLIASGLPEDNIVLDPGIGFGKTLEHNLALLKRMDEFLEFGRPLLVGISMKSFFGALLGLSVDDRGEGTSVASALLWTKGIFWHRVHNVANVRRALQLAHALAGEHAPNSFFAPKRGELAADV